EALVIRRRATGRQKVHEVGEGRASHEVGSQIAPANPNPLGRRGGDLRLRRAGLADQHDVSSPGLAVSLAGTFLGTMRQLSDKIKAATQVKGLLTARPRRRADSAVLFGTGTPLPA